MKSKLVFTAAIAAVALVACDSGDINIRPQTSVQNSNNTTNNGGQTNSQFLLRGKFVGASLPALPLLGFGVLVAGMAFVGARAAMRKR